MGQLLKERGIIPQLIVSSDAFRAKTTARLVATELGYPENDIVLRHSLYLSSPQTMLDVLAETGAGKDHVMLVAHNPGMTDLANRLSDARIDNLPTCGVFMVEADIDDWTKLQHKPARFSGFLCPRQDLDKAS
jgi:phosphohistidine phosphatase